MSIVRPFELSEDTILNCSGSAHGGAGGLQVRGDEHHCVSIA